MLLQCAEYRAREREISDCAWGSRLENFDVHAHWFYCNVLSFQFKDCPLVEQTMRFIIIFLLVS